MFNILLKHLTVSVYEKLSAKEKRLDCDDIQFHQFVRLFSFRVCARINHRRNGRLVLKKMHHYLEGEAYCAQILAFPTGVTPILQLGLSFYSHVSEPGARRMDPLVDRQC